jgi:hypothetical protein
MKNVLDRGYFALGATAAVLFLILFLLILQYLQPTWLDDEAVFGAIVGGSISGVAALTATILANYFLLKTAASQQRKQAESYALSTFTRLNKLRDVIVKSYAHYHSKEKNDSLWLSENNRFPTPLQSSRLAIQFSEKDLVVVLNENEAGLFNRIVDAESILGQLVFLQDHYSEKFFSFTSNALSQQTVSKSGLKVEGEVVVDEFQIAQLKDARNHLLSFIDGAFEEIRKTHEEYISFLDRKFGKKITFEDFPDVSARAQISDKYLADEWV